MSCKSHKNVIFASFLVQSVRGGMVHHTTMEGSLQHHWQYHSAASLFGLQMAGVRQPSNMGYNVVIPRCELLKNRVSDKDSISLLIVSLRFATTCQGQVERIKMARGLSCPKRSTLRPVQVHSYPTHPIVRKSKSPQTVFLIVASASPRTFRGTTSRHLTIMLLWKR